MNQKTISNRDHYRSQILETGTHITRYVFFSIELIAYTNEKNILSTCIFAPQKSKPLFLTSDSLEHRDRKIANFITECDKRLIPEGIAKQSPQFLDTTKIGTIFVLPNWDALYPATFYIVLEKPQPHIVVVQEIEQTRFDPQHSSILYHAIPKVNSLKERSPMFRKYIRDHNGKPIIDITKSLQATIYSGDIDEA